MGYATLDELDKDGNILGSVSLGGTFTGTVIRSDTDGVNYYFGSSSGKIAKLDANMSHISTVKPSTTSDNVIEVATDSGDMYAVIGNDVLYKYNASGSKVYETSIGSDVMSMDVGNGKVIIGTTNGYVLTYDASTGSRTSYVLYSSGNSRISKIKALGNGKALAGSWDGNVYEVNVSNGGKSGTYNTGGFLEGIDVDGNFAYIGSGSRIKKLDLTTGASTKFFSFGGKTTAPMNVPGGDSPRTLRQTRSN